MNRIIPISLLALAAAPMALAAQSGSNVTRETKTFSYAVTADGLNTVRLQVKVGKISVNTTPGNKVSITTSATAGESMHFIFDWTNGKAAGKLPSGLHLATHRDGDTLVVSLESNAKSAGGRSSHTNTITENPVTGSVDNINIDGHSSPGWKSDWRVTLPTHLAMHLVVGVGKATVDGIGGGLDAKIGVGKLDTWLPRGPLKADVGVGDIKAYVRDTAYHNVNLSAGVGHVEFYVKGQLNTTGSEQHWTASSQKLEGNGTADYTLKAGVGHVRLKLGANHMEADTNGQDNSNPRH